MKSLPRVLIPALAALVVAAPLTAAGILPGGVPGVSEAPWGVWGVETLWEDYTVEGMDIAVDGQDRPVVAFTARPWPNTLWVGVKTGPAGWDFVEVREWGNDPSLVIQDGSIHMAYWNSNYDDANEVPDPQVEYATASAVDGEWSVEVVDTRTPAGQVALAMTPEGDPHVMYRVGTDTLVHAWRENGTWQQETVHTANNAASYVGAAADAQGNLHVSYSVHTRGNSLYYDLNYAHFDGSGWSVEAVLDDFGRGNSIDVDSQGDPHISCSSVSGLHHVEKRDGVWVDTQVDDGSSELRPAYMVHGETSIELDAQDRPHIAYKYLDNVWSGYDLTTPGRPHYATQLSDGSWWTMVVDHVARDNGDSPSLALDSQGRPHVTYQLTQRVNTWGCSTHPLNECNDLRYATPVQSALTPLGE